MLKATKVFQAVTSDYFVASKINTFKINIFAMGVAITSIASPVTNSIITSNMNSDQLFSTTMQSLLDQPKYVQVASNEYHSIIANIWIGTKLYLASTKEYIGEVVDIKSDVKFPDGTIEAGIQIKFPDNFRAWVPRRTAIRIYVTK